MICHPFYYITFHYVDVNINFAILFNKNKN